MKKFKIKDDTTLDEIEEELKRMCASNIPEIELNDIVKIARFLGCEYLGGCGGSQVRFRHSAVKTYNNFFGVHLIHGKKIECIRKIDFKRYLYNHLTTIINSKR